MPSGKWRMKAHELAELVKECPADQRHLLDALIASAVREFHDNMADDVNDAGLETQLLCLFEEDGPEGVEKWLRQSIAYYTKMREGK